MSYHDAAIHLDEVTDALNADFRVRGFSLAEGGDNGDLEVLELDVELERDEPTAELLRRLASVAPNLGAVTGEDTGAAGVLAGRPEAPRRSVSRQTGILALMGPPDEDRSRPATLGHALMRAAQGDNGVTVVDPDGSALSLTWAELLDIALQHAERLRDASTESCARALVAAVEPSATLLAFWSCIMADLDPILVPAELLTAEAPDIERWVNALRAELDISLIVRQDETAEFAGEVWHRLAPGVETIGVPRNGLSAPTAERREAWLRDRTPEADSARTVAFMTSGSTGRPKVVAQRHGAILSVAAGASRMNHLDSTDVSLNWMPLSHVGGILMTLVRDMYIGARHISVATNRILADPEEWFRIVDGQRVTATWSPNFAVKLLARSATSIRHRGVQTYDLSSLRFYLNGGEPVSVIDVRDFDDSLAPFGLRPGTVTPAWGMTETCSGVVYNRDLDSGRTAPSIPSVGFPLPGIEVRILPLDEQAPDGPIIGHLEVRGPAVLERYAVGAGAAGPDPSGWFRTGDLGWIAEDGLHISGRDDSRIIINGVNWNAADIESAVERVPGVAPATAAAVGHNSGNSGTEDLLVFCAAGDEFPAGEIANSVREHLLGELRLVVRRVTVIPESDIKRTAIGKIKKKDLIERFANAALSDRDESPVAGGIHGSRLVWRRDLAAKAAASISTLWLRGPESANPGGAGQPPLSRGEWLNIVLHGDDLNFTGEPESAEALLSQCCRWEPWLDEHVGWIPRTALITVLIHDHSNVDPPRTPTSHPLAAWLRAALNERGFGNVRNLWVSSGVSDGAVRSAVGIADLRDRLLTDGEAPWTRSLVPAEVTAGPSGPGHYVLIGGTGRLGSTLADRLMRTGHRVTSVGRNARPAGADEDTRLSHVECDITTAAGCDALLQVLEDGGGHGALPIRLVHLAGSPDGPGTPPALLLEDVLRPKIAGLRNTLSLARRLHAPLTVISSANAHLGGAGVPLYAAACSAAEMAAALETAHMEVTVISCSKVEGAEHRSDADDVAALSGIKVVPLDDLVGALACAKRPPTLLLGVASRNRYVNEEGTHRVRVSIPEIPHEPGAVSGGDDLTRRLQDVAHESFPDLGVNVKDNWFDLGLTSVDLPLLAQRITAETGVEVSLVDMMRNPSITALAASLAGRPATATATATATEPSASGGGER